MPRMASRLRTVCGVRKLERHGMTVTACYLANEEHRKIFNRTKYGAFYRCLGI